LFFTAACAQVINVVRKRTFPFLVLPDFLFLALSLSPGHNPAQEEMCLSVGKRSMSVPMTEMMAGLCTGVTYAVHILDSL